MTLLSPSYPIASLYVGNLHPDINEATLFEKFSQAGPVVSIRVCRDVITRRSLGYAYVNFQQPADAERALDTMNFDAVKGHPMHIKIKWSQRTPKMTLLSPSYPIAALYVSNLHPDINEAMLFEKFSQAGPVVSIRVCRDVITRRSLGYAYVNFQQLADAKRALDTVNFDTVKGRPMHRRPLHKSCIFIKNLDKSIDNKALYDTFSAFGGLDEHGQSKGYGFVHFETQESADMAILKVNGMLLNDKKVFVGIFVARKERLRELGHNQHFTNVYIKNFGEDFNDQMLQETFEKFGKIVSSVVMMDRHTDKSRGFGFVNYESHEAAAAAVDTMNGQLLNGRMLYVGRAQKRKERQMELQRKHEADRMERYSKYQGVNLYVKNLEDDFDDERLRKQFSKFGNITSAKVMVDETARFGFVCFSSPEEATKAVTEMNGRIVVSKPLYVALAQRREERQAHLAALRMQRIASRGGGMQNQMQMQMYPAAMYGLAQNQRAYFPHMPAAGFRPWQSGPMHGRPFGYMPQRNRPNVPRGQMNMGGSRMATPSAGGGRMGPQRMQQQMPSQQSGPMHGRPFGYMPQRNRPNVPRGQMNMGGSRMATPSAGGGRMGPQRMQQQMLSQQNQMQMQMYPAAMYGLAQNQRAYFPHMPAAGFRPWQSGPMHGRPFGYMPQRNRPNVPRGQMNTGGSRMATPSAGGGRMGPQRMQQQMPSQQGVRGMKMTPQARNPPAQQGAQSGAGVSSDILTTLSTATQQQQKQIIGEHLYRQIFSMHGKLSGKITGMLLEMDNSELLHLLEVPESLQSKVKEVVSVLQQQIPSQQGAQQGAQSGAGVSSDILTTLSTATQQQQKQIIGEHLYRQIFSMHGKLSGKITGMLLELDNSELLHMLEVPESLQSKVKEVVSVLQQQMPSQQGAQQGAQSGVGVFSDILATLSTATRQQQKQIIGEHLYCQIFSMHGELSGKITGMLLEMDNSELLHMLEVPESLQSKVKEVVSVLQQQIPSQQGAQQGAQSGAGVSSDILATLSTATRQQQKQIIGEHLYRQIFSMHGELSGKITGMLLEMDNSELLHMLEVPESLQSKVKEAVSVLQEHQSTVPPTITPNAIPIATES